MSRFTACLAVTLAHEGGYSHHPADPGGATMQGITQRTYDAWRGGRGLPPRPVAGIARDEVEAICRARYWDAVRGDALPAGLDLAVFDYAVNSGPGRAARELQRVLGTAADGRIGPVTLAAARAADPARAIERLCDRRLAFLRRLRTWPVFGRGWTRRVAVVRATALAMSAGNPAA